MAFAEAADNLGACPLDCLAHCSTAAALDGLNLLVNKQLISTKKKYIKKKIKNFLHEINTYPVFSGNKRRVFKPDEAPSSPNSNSGGSLWNRKIYLYNIYII